MYNNIIIKDYNVKCFNYIFFLFLDLIIQETIINIYYKHIYIYNKFNFKNNFLVNRKINNYLISTCLYYWFKIVFRGKGYRFRKFKNTNKLTCNFGYSHWSKILFNNKLIYIKKQKKQKFFCITIDYFEFKIFKDIFKTIKKLNCYTKRGLRLKKQYIKRRFGKISQVVSSLH